MRLFPALTCAALSAFLALPVQAAQVPTPAQSTPAPLPTGQVAAAMGMNDAAAIGKVMLDELELGGGDAGISAAWEAQAWYGTDYNKLWLKSEGEWFAGSAAQGRYEALWDRAALRWWDAQAGIRYDLGRGPSRGWAALGVQGIAPYNFDLEATLYLGEAGRTAARVRVEHDLLFTQRLILQPELETDLYGRSDPARRIGAGVSDLQLALRLRYEIRRELAPYLGVVWRREFGGTARLDSARGGDPDVLQWVAGAHIWF
ncbi:MAG: copper resistance protein B [Steroidobacteraceae bacterium]